MDVERAVAVGKEESAVMEKGEGGGHETVLAPGAGGLGVFFRGVDAGLDGCVLLPGCSPFEVHLGERLEVLVGADVEIFLAPFFADLDAVPAPLELLSERPDVLAGRIEDEDRRMLLLVGLPLVNNIN